MYVSMYVCMYVRRYVCMYVSMYVRTYVCIYMYLYHTSIYWVVSSTIIINRQGEDRSHWSPRNWAPPTCAKALPFSANACKFYATENSPKIWGFRRFPGISVTFLRFFHKTKTSKLLSVSAYQTVLPLRSGQQHLPKLVMCP